MVNNEYIQTRVRNYYWHDDINCATTNLKILSERFKIKLSDQVFDAAIGMHGAGAFGAQCGLVEGTLMFLGVLGRVQNIPDTEIVKACREFAEQFERRFKSLLCKVIRPQGFNSENPPHLCEQVTCDAIKFNIEYVAIFLDNNTKD